MGKSTVVLLSLLLLMADVHSDELRDPTTPSITKLSLELDVTEGSNEGGTAGPDAEGEDEKPLVLQTGKEDEISLVLQKRRDVSDHPESFVVVHNVAKRHNIGTLARSATAFGVSVVLTSLGLSFRLFFNLLHICAVGRRDFNTFGSHGAADHVDFKHFFTLTDVRRFLKEERGCTICGVEIVDSAVPVQDHPFTGNTAFILGNEGMGLSEKEMEICDSFVYIPQHGQGTASLNVTIAASIVLHHFAVWARLPERERLGQKFVVAERPVRRGRRNMCPESEEELEERRRQRAQDKRDWTEEEGATALFEEEEDEEQGDL